nr:ClbS/DfsB family four-helix bundle protein [Maribacter sp. Hal144]
MEDARKILGESFASVQKVIRNHTEGELFEKKKYKWTGSTSLATYLISATSSHYDWAYKLINKCKKEITIELAINQRNPGFAT